MSFSYYLITKWAGLSPTILTFALVTDPTGSFVCGSILSGVSPSVSVVNTFCMHG